MKLRIPKLDMAVWAAIAVGVGVAGVFAYWALSGTKINITNNPDVPNRPVSPLSGLPCERAAMRPIAVMLGSDAEARPLSGIGQADMVFEMPVTPNGITRMMAVYQCQTPVEMGSIRSARQDFIPLAQGVDAILVHWGGEHNSLAALNGHIIDNIDALIYEGTTFYRKQSIPRPYNGFTSWKLLQDRAQTFGYRASTSVTPYVHVANEPNRNLGALADTVNVPWPQGMDVRFTFNPASNTYLRSRGGTPEIDISTGKQAAASVVVVMQTDATFLREQYINVRTLGQGVATIWQAGRRINALWKKPTATDMLQFTDSKGEPIPLEPGTIWVLIDAPLPPITP
jgi:hypothetical protein